MEKALVNQVQQTYHGEKACILTNTNYEALQIAGLLTQKGIRAKLIQSNDGFSLYNLAEVRFFLKFIDDRLNSPVIDNTIWEQAKERLSTVYSNSSCLSNCLKMVKEFEKTNPIKFRTDFEEFIRESNYDDFYEDDADTLCISTIHKAKGREFDTVYLFLRNVTVATDEERRKLYVALTRAKNSLYIHCNTNLFAHYVSDSIIQKTDTSEYTEPNEIMLQLTHKDVVLDFFKGRKEIILNMRSGNRLAVAEVYLIAEVNGRTAKVVKFSKAFLEKLDLLSSQGYTPYAATINYVVAWQGENDEEESAIILPMLSLHK